jgi:hypothetical protein
MSADLLAKAVAAHGGLDRWNQYASVRAAVSVGGALWAAKGRPGVLAYLTVEARLHEQRVTTHLNGRGKTARSARQDFIQAIPSRLRRDVVNCHDMS